VGLWPLKSPVIRVAGSERNCPGIAVPVRGLDGDVHGPTLPKESLGVDLDSNKRFTDGDLPKP